MAQGAAQAAAALVKRAQAAVDAAKAALAAFAGLDARISQWHADKLRGGAAAANSPLPSHLAAGRRAKADAELALSDAEAAAVLLAGESSLAAAAAGAADDLVRGSVIGVVRDDARDLVRRLREVEAEAGRLRGAAATYANQWSGADERWKPVPWEVTVIAHDAHHGMIADLAGTAWPEVTACWAAYLQALARDPDAAPPACLRP